MTRDPRITEAIAARLIAAAHTSPSAGPGGPYAVWAGRWALMADSDTVAVALAVAADPTLEAVARDRLVAGIQAATLQHPSWVLRLAGDAQTAAAAYLAGDLHRHDADAMRQVRSAAASMMRAAEETTMRAAGRVMDMSADDVYALLAAADRALAVSPLATLRDAWGAALHAVRDRSPEAALAQHVIVPTDGVSVVALATIHHWVACTAARAQRGLPPMTPADDVAAAAAVAEAYDASPWDPADDTEVWHD